jgi:hypothetical protein
LKLSISFRLTQYKQKNKNGKQRRKETLEGNRGIGIKRRAEERKEEEVKRRRGR